MSKDIKLKWIIIDSLMFRQLKYAPFLRSVAEKYRADFIPPLGYQEDGLSFFSGKKPNQINIGPLFCYNPESSIFSWLRPFKGCGFLDWPVLKYALLVLAHFFNKERHLGISNIPIRFIGNFDIATHCLKSDNHILKIKTIFDDYESFAFIKGPWLITDKGDNFIRNFFRNIFCRGDKTTLKMARQYKDKDLAIIWLLELDSIAHKFGPDSPEVANHIKKIDRWLADYLKGEKFIIHSDHGMAEVKSAANFLEIFKEIPFKPGKDYLFFLDSIMARFWFFNPGVSKIIKEKLEGLNIGHFLDSREKVEFGYDFSDNRFGEEFFILDQGKIILPNYFQKKAPKAMHGYLPQGEQKGVFLSNLDLPRKDKIFYDEILTLIQPFIYG